MATANVPLTRAGGWVKIAEDTDDAFCASSRFQQELEYAAWATDEDPTVGEGAALSNGMAASRASHPTGFVFVRIAPRSNESTAVVVVTK